MKVLELNPKELELKTDIDMRLEEYVLERINLHMAEIYHVNEAIFSMCSSGRLTVSEVKIENNEQLK